MDKLKNAKSTGGVESSRYYFIRIFCQRGAAAGADQQRIRRWNKAAIHLLPIRHKSTIRFFLSNCVDFYFFIDGIYDSDRIRHHFAAQ